MNYQWFRTIQKIKLCTCYQYHTVQTANGPAGARDCTQATQARTRLPRWVTQSPDGLLRLMRSDASAGVPMYGSLASLIQVVNLTRTQNFFHGACGFRRLGVTHTCAPLNGGALMTCAPELAELALEHFQVLLRLVACRVCV